MKQSYVYALVTLLALGVAGCGKKTGDSGGGGASSDTAATVNGDNISEKELLSYLSTKMNVNVITQQGQSVPAQATEPLAMQGMEELIKRKIWLQIAKEQNLLPTDAEVNAELDKRVAENPNYITGMTQQLGLTLDQIKQNILNDLVQYKLITRGVTVTKDDVDSYIKEHKAEMVQPASADVLAVVVSSEAKKKPVDQDLANGSSFPTIVNRYSEDPSARQNGGKTTLPLSVQTPFTKAVQATDALKTTNWIPVSGKFVKFYVQKKTQAKPIEITDKIREAIQRRLAVQRGQMANDLDKMAFDKAKASKIEVQVPGLKNIWDQAFAKMKSASSTPAGAPGGRAPSAGAPSAGAPGAGAPGTAVAPGAPAPAAGAPR